jgi:hypothetical protein
MKNLIYNLGNQIRDLPVCSPVPQTTVPLQLSNTNKCKTVQDKRLSRYAKYFSSRDKLFCSAQFEREERVQFPQGMKTQ